MHHAVFHPTEACFAKMHCPVGSSSDYWIPKIPKAKGLPSTCARPEFRARPVAIDFFTWHVLPNCAAAQFFHVADHGFCETFEGAALIGKAWITHRRRLHNSLA